MGNASTSRITSNNGEINRGDNQIDLRGDCKDFIDESPNQITHSSPLPFTPQISLSPLEGNIWVNNNHLSDEKNDILKEEIIPIMLTWNHGGTEVFIQGSWDNWKTEKPLQKFGEEFYILKMLHSGYYQYRFIVDGKINYSPDFPLVHDENGNIYNLLDVQEKTQENLESISNFDPPKSPESSYANVPLNSKDFTKEPPELPPQLNLTLLNELNNEQSCHMRAPHVSLNHIYIKRGNFDNSVVAIGETCRFLAKHVTVVLYKSLQG